MKHKKETKKHEAKDKKNRNPKHTLTHSAIKRSRDKSTKYKKFKGNLKEGQGFADKRKIKMVQQYRKTLRKDQNSLTDWSDKTKQIYREEAKRENDEKRDSNQTESPKRKKPAKSRFQKAEERWRKEQEEKEKHKQEMLKIQKEREEALEKYQKKKTQKHKKLCVKNYKGQPNMASQMDLLLSKIQATKNTS